jgi:small subunit ribosomal protein S17
MDKTIVVRVERVTRHPLYGKVLRRAKKFYAHDEQNEAQEGDRVRIMESKPYSKTKRWVLMEILERPERV